METNIINLNVPVYDKVRTQSKSAHRYNSSDYKRYDISPKTRISDVQRRPVSQYSLREDEFEKEQTVSQRKAQQTAVKRSEIKIPTAFKTYIAGLATALLIGFGVSQANNTPATVTIPFDCNEDSISEIAEQYGCDEELILSCNGIDGDTDLSTVLNIVIPKEYNYVQDEITKLQNSLYSSGLTKEERDEITWKIDALKVKQKFQNEVARAYTDGEFIYFVLDITDENGKPFMGGINGETFKDLFDIKDGEIRKYNDLNRVWKKGSDFEGDHGYYDYTNNIFHTGDVIKVRMSAIDLDNIDLEGLI